MTFLLALQVGLYALFPFFLATLDGPLRRVSFYLYLGLVLGFGGFVGSVFSIPVVDGVNISAGNMAYGAFMMTSILFVIVERDLFIIRSIVWLVIGVNLFKVLLFLVISLALEQPGIINPNNTAPALFKVSVPFTILGGALIIGELLLLLFSFEQLKKLTSNAFRLAIAYIFVFVAVLCLDGVLFPAIAFAFNPALVDIVIGGVQGKLLMALAYSLPMLLFLFVFRNQLVRYIEHPPFSWRLLLTSSERLMQDLRVKDERLRQSAVVYENTREGIIVTDPEFRIVNFNKAFARLTGLDDAELIGRNPTLESIQPVNPDFYGAMEQALLDSGRWQGEIALSHQSGSVQNQLLSINAVRDEAGELLNYVGVFTDITRRKQVERERELLIDDLEDKNIRLERFVYSISHELKTPLVTIAGFTGMLRRDFEQAKTEQVDAHFMQIESALADMSVLLEDLLKLARLGYVENKLEAVSLTELATRAADQIRMRRAGENAVIDIAADMPVVRVDRNRMLEVLQNLLDNAVKFSAGSPDPKVSVDAVEDGEQIVVTVRDNGLGIDPQYHDRVFKMFERLNSDIEGTGVGLALVRGIVESHGGKIWIESDGAGQGCAFRFSLPKLP